MKTAISIPDPLFKQADRLAKRLRVSRSELYSKAVRALVSAYGRRDVTARINAVLGPMGEGSELDEDLRDAADEVIDRTQWHETR